MLDAVGEEGDEREQSKEDDAHVRRRGVAHHPVVPVLEPVSILVVVVVGGGGGGGEGGGGGGGGDCAT